MSYTRNSEDTLPSTSALPDGIINDQSEQPVTRGIPYNSEHGSPTDGAQQTPKNTGDLPDGSAFTTYTKVNSDSIHGSIELPDSGVSFDSESLGACGYAGMNSSTQNCSDQGQPYLQEVNLGTASLSSGSTNRHSRQESSDPIENNEHEENVNSLAIPMTSIAVDNTAAWDDLRPSMDEESCERPNEIQAHDLSRNESIDLGSDSPSKKYALISIDKGKAPALQGQNNQASESIKTDPFKRLPAKMSKYNRARLDGSLAQNEHFSGSHDEYEPPELILKHPKTTFAAYIEDIEDEDFVRAKYQRADYDSRRNSSPDFEYEGSRSSEADSSPSQRTTDQGASHSLKQSFPGRSNSPTRATLVRRLRTEWGENEEPSSVAVHSGWTSSDSERVYRRLRRRIRFRSSRNRSLSTQSSSQKRSIYPPGPSPPNTKAIDYKWQLQSSGDSSPTTASEPDSRRSDSSASDPITSPPYETSGYPDYRHNDPYYTTNNAYPNYPSNTYSSNPFSTRPYSTYPYSTYPYSTYPYSTYPYSTYPYSTYPYSTYPYSTYPYSTYPYSTYPYPNNPYPSNPYPSNPYPSNPYPSNPYPSNLDPNNPDPNNPDPNNPDPNNPYSLNNPKYHPDSFHHRPPPAAAPPSTDAGVASHGYRQNLDAAGKTRNNLGDDISQPSPIQEPQSTDAPMRNPALSYKHPVDFDNSANEISLQVVLQDLTPKVLGSCTLSGAWSQDATSKLSRTGTGHLSRTLALEHYADGLGHDKITLISPNSLDQNSPADQSTHLRWLHLKQSTLCLNDLAEMVENCPFLDQDYILLALRLLQEGCSKFERSNSTKNHRGYYLEPGTVLRCDGRYDDLSRGEKSVLFCSAPYLKLDRQCDTERKPESGEARIHHIRTLLESLYDYDLMEERDNKQVIRKTAPELQDIICVPQVWYLLCGSHVLISCGPASLEELYGDSVQQRPRSDSLIAIVTDFNNRQYAVALKTTNSYYAVVRRLNWTRQMIYLVDTFSIAYEIELEGGELLTPKKWLDITKMDNLPLLKMTLRLRSRYDSLALVRSNSADNNRTSQVPAIAKHTPRGNTLEPTSDSDNESAGVTTHYKKQEDSHPFVNNSSEIYQPAALDRQNGLENNDLAMAHTTKQDSFQNPSSPFAYHLNSYRGWLTDLSRNDETHRSSGKVNGQVEGYDNPHAPLALSKLNSRYEETARRVSSLNSQGIIVNDARVLSTEPDVFKPGQEELGSKGERQKSLAPNVWDFLVDNAGIDENNFLERAWGHDKVVKPKNLGRASKGADQALENGKSPEKRETLTRGVSSDTLREDPSLQTPKAPRTTPVKNMASVPFFQWDSSNSYGSSIESDSILHRVLDQINFRLRNDQRRTKQYKIMNEASIYDVTEPLFRNNPYNYNPFVDPNDVDAQQCPYFNWPETSQNCAEAAPETMDDDADKILWYRKIFAAKLSIGLFTASKLLIEMFIPMNFEHEITGKLCGALVMISQSVNDVCALKEEVSDSIYYVQDYRDEDIRNSVVLETPRPPFARCSTCSAGFNSLEGGMFHLEKIHFGVDQPQRSPPYNEARRLYLRTPSQIEIEARIKNVVTIVQECDSFIKELRDKANELLIGATRPNSSEGNGYPVMEKLVRVFEHILVLLMLTAHSASRASKLRIENDNDIRRGQKIVAQSLREIRLVYIEAQKYFERAKVDIILASKVDSLTGSLTLASIGPEFLIALVSNGLFLRPLKATSGKSIDACERYKNHTTMLRFQVNHQPKRRLFKDIYGLEEELDILRRVIHWQRKFSNNLMRVLDPKSYKTTTKDRISHYHTEKSYISRTLKHLDERDLEFGALQVRAHRLREQLKQSIEIREESHGKAIRVFTFVTVFFLPLSFVTSFMGMNTSDIRDIDRDQTFFWTLAVPITTVVLGLSYIYGYKWDGWKEEIARRWQEKCARFSADPPSWARSPMLPRALRQTSFPIDDIELGNISRQGTGLSHASSQRQPKKRARFRF